MIMTILLCLLCSYNAYLMGQSLFGTFKYDSGNISNRIIMFLLWLNVFINIFPNFVKQLG